MNYQTFRAHFITQFLATWVAQNHADACARGEHWRLRNPPCEDAEDLAKAAWGRLQDLLIVRNLTL
jgi:hypothetical protein